jgi:3-oxoacyl-[acyl-carrier protein] reductase
MRLKNKVAVLTGGCGGIGKAVANKFLFEGARIAIFDFDREALGDFLHSIKRERDIFGIPVNVYKVEEVKKAVRQVLRRFESIDILVNAAGIQGPIGPFIEGNIQDWMNNIKINLVGTVICCKAVLPVMVNRKKGKIINFAGGGANFPRPNFSAYSVSKAGVVRLTEILADELKYFNIQVNAISPGVIKTKMIDEIIEAGAEKVGDEYDKIKEKLSGSFDSPDLAAELVCYLASDDAYWITGKVISAIWDPWRDWKDIGPVEIDKDLYVLRRIDGKKFIKLKDD